MSSTTQPREGDTRQHAQPFEPRTVLVHLNVTVPPEDERGADEIADALLAAIEVGSDDDSVRSLGVGGLASGNGAPITCTLAEEV